MVSGFACRGLAPQSESKGQWLAWLNGNPGCNPPDAGNFSDESGFVSFVENWMGLRLISATLPRRYLILSSNHHFVKLFSLRIRAS